MRKFLIAALALALFAVPVLAADDSSVLGKGKMELEADLTMVDFGLADATTLVTTFTYGFNDQIDFKIELPYLVDSSADVSGMGDISLGAQWKFFVQDAWSLAVQPFIVLATGDEEVVGVGDEMDFGVEFIASYAKDPLTVDINLIYFAPGEDGADNVIAWDVEGNYKMAPWTFIGEVAGDDADTYLGNYLKLGAAYKLNDTLELEGDFETDTEEFMDFATLTAVATWTASPQLEIEFDLGFGIGDLTEDYTLFEIDATYSF